MKLFLLVALLFCWPIYAKPQSDVSTLYFTNLPNNFTASIGAEVVKVAYQKLGIQVEFVDMPTKRALVQSNEGKVDGEIHRIWSIADSYPNLIRVPTPINYIDQVVFGSIQNAEIKQCADLAPYSVGIVRGVKHAEECTRDLPLQRVFNTDVRMMALLSAQKIDFAVSSWVNGMWLRKSMNIDNVHVVGPPISRQLLYHYVHKKHADLVDKIDAVFQEMQESGELELVRKQVINELLKNAH
ncbi:ABC transporter substrate-binding protein [Agarivorans sp. Alg241-V36]|uniref:substrate-binding periplasmic protein n=1 Tax=Agarivorans sp. Alg241-V36 TaxID=2305992 RepID=UPI0013D6A995|nr:transporter substrate-binding domain-containing protein [Agarivorans sp. Alg241-V36]